MTNKLLNKRENWIDLIKGISALFVMLTHISNTPFVYKIFYSYIMLPAFFFASGYLTKNEKTAEYLYNRVLKLFVIYVMYSLITFFVSLSNVNMLIKSPVSFLESFMENVQNILLGKSLWFIASLIVISIIFCIIKAVTKNNYSIMFFISAAMFILALVFVKSGRKPWSIDTSCICQFFFICGYIIKQTRFFYKIKHSGVIGFVSGIFYVILIYGAYLIWGEEAVGITVGINEWKMILITIPALVLGNIFIFFVARRIESVPLINYVGSHALIYYAFASHGLSVFTKLFKLAGMHNPYIMNLLTVVLTAVAMAVVCKLIDRFLPFLNGNFKLPKLNFVR